MHPTVYLSTARGAAYAAALLLISGEARAQGTRASVSDVGARTSRVAPTVRFGEVRLATGVRLHYAEQGSPSGQAIVLLHGYSDSWFSFSPVLPLMPASYRVYALDLRGHGDSDRPLTGYAMGDLAADVIAFMDAKNVAKAVVVGHSMGSFVAQQVALRAPGRVSRLVLEGSATSVRGFEGMGDLQRVVDSLGDPVPREFVREFQYSTIYQPLPAEFMDRVVEESLKLPARVWRAMAEGMLAMAEPTGLADKRIPTLIVWGDRDAIFPLSEQEALSELIPTSTLKVYRETGHTLHWERPEAFVKDLVEFIERPVLK